MKSSPSSSLISAQSYPRAKSDRVSSFLSSETGFCSKAEASTDLPDDGGPNNNTCFEGIDLEEETESKIDNHRFSGGASGVAGRDPSMIALFKTSSLC